MVGVPRFDVAGSLRSVCFGLYRRDHVFDPGTAAENPAAAFDFLLSSAANRLVRCDNKIVVVGIRSLYAGIGQRFFCWAAVTEGPSAVCVRSLAVVCGGVVRPASQPIR